MSSETTPANDHIAGSKSFLLSSIALISLFILIAWLLFFFLPEDSTSNVSLPPSQTSEFNQPDSANPEIIESGYQTAKKSLLNTLWRELSVLRLRPIGSVISLAILFSIILHWRSLFLIHANLYKGEASPSLRPQLPEYLRPNISLRRPYTWKAFEPRFASESWLYRFGFLFIRIVNRLLVAIARIGDFVFASPDLLYRCYRNIRWYLGLISTRTIGRLIFLFFRPIPPLPNTLRALLRFAWPSYFGKRRSNLVWKAINAIRWLTLIIGALLELLLLEPRLAARLPEFISGWSSGTLQPLRIAFFVAIAFFATILVIDFIVWSWRILHILLNSNLIYARARIYVEVSALTNSNDISPSLLEAEIARRYEEQSLEFARKEKEPSPKNRWCSFIKRLQSFFSEPLLEEKTLGQPTLVCGTVFDIHNQSDAIRTYFESLAEIQSDPFLRRISNFFRKLLRFFVCEDRSTQVDQFICPVSIATGYLCPKYLVSGLLSEYDEDWRDIIWSARDTELHLREDDRLRQLSDLRRLQAFIWNCWVQWGPSIPISDSPAWKKENDSQHYVALQYGYGDENNSLLVTSTSLRTIKMLEDYWQAKLKIQSGKETVRKPVPVLATGVSGSLFWNRKDLLSEGNKLHEVQQAHGKKGRPVLFVNEQQTGRPDSIIHRFESAPFYSAYVWVMFAITDGSTEPAKLVYPFMPPLNDNKPAEDKDYVNSVNSETWRGLIPFFQHGNIADHSVYEAIKRELAAKVIDSLFHILSPEDTKPANSNPVVNSSEHHPIDLTNVGFSYVCAFDDNGDGSSSIVGDLGEKAATILQLLVEELDDHQGFSQQPSLKTRVRLSHDACREIAAHNIPEIVGHYLAKIEAKPSMADTIIVDLRELAAAEGYWKDDLTSLPPQPGNELSRAAFNAFARLYHQEFIAVAKKPQNTSDTQSDTSFRLEFSEDMSVYVDRVMRKVASSPWTRVLVAFPRTQWETFKDERSNPALAPKAHGFIVTEWYPQSQCGLVAYIAVDKRARQQGLAKQLMQAAFKNLWEANGYQIPNAVFAEAEYLPARHDSLQSDRLVALNRMGGYLVPLGNLYRQPALSPDAQLGENLVLLTFDMRKVLPTNDSKQFQFPDREIVKQFLKDYFKCHEQFNSQLNISQNESDTVGNLLSLNIIEKEQKEVKDTLRSHYGIESIPL